MATSLLLMKCMSKACHALANWGIWEKRKTIPGTPMDYHLMQINWTLSLPYWRDRIVWVASYDVRFQNRQKAWTSKSSYVMKTSPFSAPKVNQSSQSLVQLSGFLYSILGPACHNTLNNSTNFLLGILLLIVLYHLPQQSEFQNIYWIARIGVCRKPIDVIRTWYGSCRQTNLLPSRCSHDDLRVISELTRLLEGICVR